MDIPVREVLHFLGWRGTPLEDTLLAQLGMAQCRVLPFKRLRG